MEGQGESEVKMDNSLDHTESDESARAAGDDEDEEAEEELIIGIYNIIHVTCTCRVWLHTISRMRVLYYQLGLFLEPPIF